MWKDRTRHTDFSLSPWMPQGMSRSPDPLYRLRIPFFRSLRQSHKARFGKLALLSFQAPDAPRLRHAPRPGRAFRQPPKRDGSPRIPESDENGCRLQAKTKDEDAPYRHRGSRKDGVRP